MHKKIIKSTMKWINHFITFILFTALAGVLFIAIASMASDKEPNIFGYQFKIVLSGSMEPDIKTGSMIMVNNNIDKNNLSVNDVITFNENNERLVTHRIVEIINNDSDLLYRTKGDHNDGPDINPVPSQNVVAKYTGLTIPYIGYVISFLQSPNGALLIIFSGCALLLYSFYTIWSTLRNVEIVQHDKN